MQFFESQDRARKQTGLLVFYFISAIVLTMVAIDAIIILTLYYSQQYSQNYTTAYEIIPVDQLIYNTTLVVVPLVVGVVLIGTLIRRFQLRAGGVSVAQLAEARNIDEGTTDPLEQRFIHIVDEMALASGQPRPLLYVMDHEPAINAFVAGLRSDDMVMVVTKGALDTLSRDELQGVIGHEYSHIANKDMELNVRLIMFLGGILAIGQTAGFLLRYVPSRSSKNEKGNSLIHVAFFVGVLSAFIVGYIGLFFGRLIKAAIARQRERLADAASVQYTRNPEGLVRALRKIQKSGKGSLLQTKHTEDISHLCFLPPMQMFFSKLLATHPPLEQRIRWLDPRGEYEDQLNKKT